MTRISYVGSCGFVGLGISCIYDLNQVFSYLSCLAECCNTFFGCKDPEIFVDHQTTKYVEAQISEIDLKVFVPALVLQPKILLLPM